jgi:WD40 repeat protein/serine/threonine protein kinase
MTSCPTPEQLRQLLAEHLSGPERDRVEAHVEVCPACQQALEQMNDTFPAPAGAETPDAVRPGDDSGSAFLRRLAGRSPNRLTGPYGDDTEDSAGGAAPRVGSRLGGYEVLEEIGRGGMGVVYLARQPGLDRLVALKVLRGDHADSEHLARFRREAEALARLRHPGIVQVYEVGQDMERPFLALEYVEGGSLAARLAGAPLLARQAAGLAEALARAVQAAHEAGVVHRDLKPANVLLARAEAGRGVALGEPGAEIFCEPKVADFGLAKRLQEGSALTQSGAIVGTPSYMAPEQARAQDGEVGPRTDVYSLGAVLYDALTGRPPFRAATVLQTLEQVCHTEPVPPAQLQPGVPRDLETVCLKCLHKEPGRRYGSARELAEDLRRFLEGRPVQARPVGRPERLWRWCRRNPWLAAASSIAVLAIVGMAVGAVAFGIRENIHAGVLQDKTNKLEEQGKELQATVVARTLATQEAEGAQKTAKEEAKRAITAQYAGQLHEALGYLEQGYVDRAERVLDQCRWDLRHLEHRYLRRLCRRRQRTLHVGGVVTAVAYSADGRRLAAASERTVTVWDASRPEGPDLEKFTLPVGHTHSVAFSPDGKRLAGGGEDRLIRVWDASGGKELLTLRGHREPVLGVAFSRDGKRLASASADDTLRLWDLAERREVLSLKGQAGGLRAVAFSPDGKTLAGAGSDGTVKLWEATPCSDPPRPRLSLKLEGAVHGVAFHPDGKRLAACSAGGMVKVWDAATGAEARSFPGHVGEVRGVAFSGDGRLLASAGADQTVRVWDMLTGGESLVLRAPDLVTSVAFSGDGQHLAGGWWWNVRVWNVTPAPGSLPLEAPSEVFGVAFSADGGRLATVGELQTKVWDTATRRRLATLPGSPTLQRGSPRLGNVAVSPNGRRVASTADGGLALYDAQTGRVERTLVEPPKPRPRPPGMGPMARPQVPGTRGMPLPRPHGGNVGGVLLIPDTVGGLGDSSLAFSGDGRRLAAGTSGGGVGVWDAATGKEIVSFQGHSGWPVYGVAFNADGTRLASCAGDGSVHVWDTATGKDLVPIAGHTLAARSVAFSPDGRLLATTTGDPDERASGDVSIWDAVTGRELFCLHGHSSQVVSVAFSADGKRLLSASGGRRRLDDRMVSGEIKVWDPATGQDLLTLPRQGNGILGLVVNADATRLLSAGSDQTVTAWEVAADPADQGLNIHHEHNTPLDSLAFRPDGRQLASASWDGVVKLWDLGTGQEVRSRRVGHHFGVASMAYSPDSRLLAVGWDAGLVVWDVTADPDRSPPLTSFRGRHHVRAVAFSPDGKHLAACESDRDSQPGQIKVWEVATGQEVITLPGHGGDVKTLAYSPDGKLLAGAGGWVRGKGQLAGEVKLWEAVTGREVLSLPGPDTEPQCVAFSADGKRLAAGSGGKVTVWDLADPHPARTCLSCQAHFQEVRGLSFSPDGKRLASISIYGLQLWDMGTGREVNSPLVSFGAGGPAAFSPDGKRLARAPGSGVIELRDVPVDR